LNYEPVQHREDLAMLRFGGWYDGSLAVVSTPRFSDVATTKTHQTRVEGELR